jgi:hypothetical protein
MSANNWDLFNNLLRSALVRLKFRRYEVPYVSTIDVLMSTLIDASVPETFEKLPMDLNAANLRIELKKIRERKKKEVQRVMDATDPDKAKADEKKDEESFELNEKLATDDELEEIKHIFVNVLLQRSKNPK